jgi:hypothetical protein
MTKISSYIFVILVSLAAFLLSQYQAFINPFAINEDIRGEFFMHRFHNRSLFQNDIYSDFFSLLLKFFPGYYYVYFFITYFFNLSYAHLFVSLVLFLISSFYIFKLGYFIRDRKTGFLMLAFFIFYFWITAEYTEGTRNIFGKTILTVFLYYLLSKNNLGLVFSLIATILFYPPLFWFFFLTIILVTLINPGYFEKKIRIIFLFIAFSFTVEVIYIYYIKIVPIYGEAFNYSEISAMPIFLKESKAGIFPFTPLPLKIKEYFLQYRFFSILLAVLLIYLRNKLFNLPKATYAFIISGLVMYQLAIFSALKLYKPETYLDYSFPIFLIILCSNGCSELLAKDIFAKKKKYILAIFLTFGTINNLSNLNTGLTIYSEKKLFEFISTLPEDAMIAGYPTYMDEVAFFAKRKIFTSACFTWPRFKKFYEVSAKRINTFFTIYYSDSPEFLYKTCRDNNIDYLLVDKKHFQKEFLSKGNFIFEPFDTFVRGIVKNRSFFLLNNILEKNKIFSDGEKFIIRIEDISYLAYSNRNN